MATCSHFPCLTCLGQRCHANTWQAHQMSIAVSLNVSRDFLRLWRKRPCYWFSQHIWVITQHWWLQLTWRAPAKWQPTDVKPPESDLRPTSERKTNWNERKKDRKGWSLWSARVNSSNYTIHMMQGYVQVIRGALYILQWLSNMQLLGHSNKEASVCLYRNGRSAI